MFRPSLFAQQMSLIAITVRSQLERLRTSRGRRRQMRRGVKKKDRDQADHRRRRLSSAKWSSSCVITRALQFARKQRRHGQLYRPTKRQASRQTDRQIDKQTISPHNIVQAVSSILRHESIETDLDKIKLAVCQSS